MGTEIAKANTNLETLIQGGKFDEVAAEDSSPFFMEERPSFPAVGLQRTFDLVWKHLREDDDVGIIGIYGMGGVGKTTLMTQINNEFRKRNHGFESILWILVSKDAEMVRIQDDIGKKIGCCDAKWNDKTQDEKAMSIFRVLRQKKFVLLLDDVWERIDLRSLGVPFPDKENECKVVFTTRSEIVCGKMEVHWKIKVFCLKWKEAWELFREKVGEDALASHPDIPELAEGVARKCGGLPLALITIGRAMACKRKPQEWRYAIEILTKSASEFSGMGDEVFPLLKFSYDSLPNDKIKSCFLYVGLFPEDFSIKKIDLIDYWIGEGFLHGSTYEAYITGYDVIGTLIHACLLEHTKELWSFEDDVKMHDVIRDMALWILTEKGSAKDQFIVQSGIQLARPQVGEWELARRVSLMKNKISELSEVPKCPNLLNLLLANNYLNLISHNFFEFMPTLTVLDLSNNRSLSELPSTISKLVSLQYLNLSSTCIKQLPSELKALVKLKYLNLDDTDCEIADEIISSLALLQVAKLQVRTVFSKTCLEKLECLEHLDCLHISIRCNSTFQRLTRSEKLQNSIRRIWICSYQDSVAQLSISSLANMNNLENLEIFNCMQQDLAMNTSEGGVAQACDGVNSIVINKTCFHSLTNVVIFNCQQLRHVTWLCFAPNLGFLRISYCFKMDEVICYEKWEQILREEGNINLFGKLETLVLMELFHLNSIHKEALLLPQLKQIRVIRCDRLTKLPLRCDSAGGRKLLILGGISWWNNLHWEDEDTRTAFLPCFQVDSFHDE